MEPLLSGLSTIFPWLIEYTIDISILICFIFIIKSFASKKLPAWWHYSLWIILLLRMIIPFKFESPLNIQKVVPISINEALFESILKEEEFVVTEYTPELSSIQQGWHIQIDDVLLILWLVCAIILGMYILAKNIKFRNVIKKEPVLTEKRVIDLLEECKVKMKINIPLKITITDKIKSPALFGYIRPKLLLPVGVPEKLNDAELSYMFMHELGHLKRHDIGVSWIITFLQIFQWFNPFVWLAFYQMRIDQESACDASVLSKIKNNQTIDYASTIVGFLENFYRNHKLPALVGILENQTQIKKRITMIVNYRKYSNMMMFISTAMLVVICVFSFSLACFEKAKEDPIGSESSATQALPAEGSIDIAAHDEGVMHEIEVVRFTEDTQEASIVTQEIVNKDKIEPPKQNPQTQEIMVKVQDKNPKDEKETAKLLEDTQKASMVTQKIVDKNKIEPEKQDMKTQEVLALVRDKIAKDGMVAVKLPSGTQKVFIVSQKLTDKDKTESPKHNPQSHDVVAEVQDNHIINSEETVSYTESIKKASAEDLKVFREVINKDDLGNYPFAADGSDRSPKTALLADRMSKAGEEESLNYLGLDSPAFSMSKNLDDVVETPDLPENKPRKGKMHNLKEFDEPPKIVRKYSLVYPYEAIAKGIEGKVTLRFTVDSQGHIQNPQVVSAEPEGIFEQAALDTIRKYKWKPAIKDGKRTNSVVKLPFSFAAI